MVAARSGAGLPPYHRLVHGRGIHNRTSPDPIPSTSKKYLHSVHTTALDMAANAAAGVAFVAVLGSAIYMHFWVKPELDEVTAMFKDLHKKRSHLIDISQKSQNMDASSVSHQTPTAPASAGHGNKTEKGTGVVDKLGKEDVKKMHSHENRIKELKTTIMGPV